MDLKPEALLTKMNCIVADVEKKTNYIFDEAEKIDVLIYTIRKCELNKKGEDYIPILYENELRDFVMRKVINLYGRMNREKRMRMSVNKEAANRV